MPDDRAVKSAITTGRQQAEKVLAFRRAVQSAQAAAPADGAAIAAAAPAPQRVLVAEGDSWFNYPWTDVLRILEDRYGYAVESVAHWGDRIETMAYNAGQLEELARRLERLFGRNLPPAAILLSGGGNDVAGQEFGLLLNHANSATPGLNELVVQGVIDDRVRLAYITLLSAISHICAEHGHAGIPIVIHGYDYPVPDGRGFLGGWGAFPGPWLEPGFRDKGYTQLSRRKQIARTLIDRFNAMLAQIVQLPAFAHVRYVDVRGALSSGADYKRWWDNELHPTLAGFQTVTERIQAKILAP
jgi:lysophospholipase L1-like esterase